MFSSKSFLFTGWICVTIALLLYSFTQIDLNLTFSQFSIWQVIQKSFQYIGYYQRVVSSVLYAGILIFLFFLYIQTIVLSLKETLTRKELWKIILIVSIILFFSYNAFSYDLFNYIFDAKIITHYGQNPYLHKAQEFFGDPMLTFMRSVHRPYPYGPTWLLVTVPLSFIGSGFFLVTFYLFKLLIVAAYLGTAFFIEKILILVRPKFSLFGLTLFALSPLVLIEGLVSAHNDIVMMFFAISSLFFLFRKNYFVSVILFVLSIGVKFASVILLPIFIYIAIQQIRNKNIHYDRAFLGMFILSFVGVLVTAFASGVNKNPELQPWYLLNFIPFAALIVERRLAFLGVVMLSAGLLISYVSFIMMGEWPKDIVQQKNLFFIISLSITGILYFISSKQIQSSIRKFF